MYKEVRRSVLLCFGLSGLFVGVPDVVGGLSFLADRPDWDRLREYDGLLTAAEIRAVLDRLYAPRNACAGWITITDDRLWVRRSGSDGPIGSGEGMFIRLAPGDGIGEGAVAGRGLRYWRRRGELPKPPAGKPLHALRVVLDPGHIGGRFAEIEERSIVLEPHPPVREGDANLTVAEILKAILTELGADVFLVRTSPKPVTRETPSTLYAAAKAILEARDGALAGADVGDQQPMEDGVQKLSELLFYRVSEIHARAQLINRTFRPDCVLAIHFNAAPWSDPEAPSLETANHLHVIVNGTYSVGEVALDDVRFAMLERGFARIESEEIALADVIARSLARATGLPPFAYADWNSSRVNDNPYLWARNLLANRLYQCPVVYLEPYVANSVAVFPRLLAGDYEGLREFDGVPVQSIYREYARAVARGLVDYYGDR